MMKFDSTVQACQFDIFSMKSSMMIEEEVQMGTLLWDTTSKILKRSFK